MFVDGLIEVEQIGMNPAVVVSQMIPGALMTSQSIMSTTTLPLIYNCSLICKEIVRLLSFAAN